MGMTTDFIFVAYFLPAYSLATTVAIYTLVSILVSAASTIALYKMIVNKSKSLTRDDELDRSFKRG
jgi:hypothetical protein